MKVAITGSIGSGKSTVTSYLIKKGYKTFSCDEYNKQLLLKGSLAYPKLKKAFPTCFINDELDKKELSKIVFNDAKEKEKLEKILHPLIIKEMKKEMKNNIVIFCEVPLLFETKLDKLFDNVLVVVTDEKIALERLKNRGLSIKESKNRLRNQMSIQDKMSRADYIIYNNGSLRKLYAQINKWLKKIC